MRAQRMQSVHCEGRVGGEAFDTRSGEAEEESRGASLTGESTVPAHACLPHATEAQRRYIDRSSCRTPASIRATDSAVWHDLQ